MTAENAFHSAAQGVSAFVHIASIIGEWDPNPNNVIPPTIAGTLNALTAAQSSPTIKQFVYTASALGAVPMLADVAFHCDASSYNDTAIELAWAPPPYEASRGGFVYMASKAEAEKAVWKFVDEKKPSFVVNTVLPFTVFGKVFSKHQSGSTAGWLRDLYNGNLWSMHTTPARTSYSYVYFFLGG
jgi:nucleoside-diphosphate-sugar epimerase